MASLEGRRVKHGTTWRVIYYQNGQKQQTKVGITTRRVALQQRARIEALLASGIDLKVALGIQKAAAVMLSGLLDRDMEWCRTRRRPRYIEMNERFMRLLIDWAGDVRIAQVDRGTLERFFTHLRDERGHTTTTINMCLRSLKAIFQRGVTEYGVLRGNPLNGIKPLSVSRGITKPKFLTREQVQLLLEQFSSPKDVHFRRLIQFYLWTGCRWTEAIDLTWGDVDLQNRLIYLGHPESQTKLRRDFPLTDRLRELLNELHCDRDGDKPYVFWRFTRNPYYVNSRLRQIRKSVEGIPDDITPHTMRHTFASHLAMQGVDLTTIASLMGHSTARITEQYAHLQPDHRKLAADKLPY